MGLNALGRKAVANYLEAAGIEADLDTVTKQIDEFIDSGGMSVVATMAAYREEREARAKAERDAENDAYRRNKVRVRFPDGIREVAGYYSCNDSYDTRPSQLRPYPMDGWEFRETMGTSPNWHAIQRPARSRYDDRDYDYSDACRYR